jgi:hypothetical protein
MANGLLPFDRAITAGREHLDQPSRPFRYALDIATAHYYWRIDETMYRTIEVSSKLPTGVLDERLDETLRLYLSKVFKDDQYARLDQAGEIDPDRSTLLHQVFVDLEAKARSVKQPPRLGRRQAALFEESQHLVEDPLFPLWLLVEPEPGLFGFELRSLQEFFAAAYLAQTARDTQQRFDRLKAIAHSEHWRNVSMFFAGRIVRNL